jgi:hypothetical protein
LEILLLAVFLVAAGGLINGLKAEINHVVEQSCLQNQSAAILGKYNDFVQASIDQQMTAYRLNLAKGDLAKAAADLAYAKRYRGDLIHIPTPAQLHAQCAKPLLK